MEDGAKAWAYYGGALLIALAVAASPLSGAAEWPASLVPLLASIGTLGEMLMVLSDGQPVQLDPKLIAYWCGWLVLSGCSYLAAHHVAQM